MAGTVAASTVLRTMQRHTVPAFTDVLALHVAQTLQGASHQPVEVTRRPRQGGNDAAAAVSSAVGDGRTLLLASGVPAPSTAGSRALQPVAIVASRPYGSSIVRLILSPSCSRESATDDPPADGSR